MNRAFPLEDVAHIAEIIGIKLARWPGNCHAIATAIWRHFPIEGARVARGHWTGPISPKSLFAGRPFAGHSWIALADGRVLDPTRFAFAAGEPAIWLGRPDHYDLAGLAVHAGRPVAAPEGPIHTLTTAQCSALAHPALPIRNKRITKLELNWLAHRPGHEFDDHKLALQTIVDLGEQALVPIDLRDAILTPRLASPDKHGFYGLPAEQIRSETGDLYRLFERYANPDRDSRIERWADEVGFELSELQAAIGALERIDGPVGRIPTAMVTTLAHLGFEFLGNGNAREIEAFVENQGIGRARLDALLRALGKRAGMALSWD